MDPIELELTRHFFSSVAEEMGAVLQRSAFSPNIKERRDFSCAIFDVSGEMVAQAAHIPVHLGSTPMSVRAALDTLEFRPGEHVVLNDPYAGGTHLPDITLITPVFWGQRLVFLVANRAHHADVGGITPGSMPLSKHIDEEGFRFGPTRLDSQLLEEVANASRTPWEREGDLRAQIAANLRGVLRLTESLSERDLEKMSRELISYSETFMRNVLSELPDGTWTAEDVLDSDGFGAQAIALRTRVTIDGAKVSVDFRDCPEQVTGPLNVPRAVTVSAVLYAFRCLAPRELPSNGGMMRCIEILTRSGSLLDAAYPAPVAIGNVETSQRVVDVVFRALAVAMPDRIAAASCGSMNNVIIGGIDPRTQRPFAYYETVGGGAGAGSGFHGASGRHTHMTNTLNTPIEALEHAYPFRVDTYCLRDENRTIEDEFRGGRGVRRRYVFSSPVTLTLMTERRQSAPWGLCGGSDGEKGNNLLIHNGTVRTLPDKFTMDVAAGDEVVLETPGGGGYGGHHRTSKPT